jgi:rod shape-determining protein MreC
VAKLREDAGAEMARTVRRIGLAGLCLIGLVLFGLWRVDSPRIERLRMALVDAAAPSVTVFARPAARLAEIVEDWERFSDVYGQNRDLRREIERLRAWREAAQVLERENSQLRALNNVRLSPRMAFATGEVIADGAGPFGHSILVNIGARDGVEDGAAAVDGAGLVGRVVGVGEEVSRILLLTDFESRVPVKILPSGRRAILTGDATAAPRLSFIAEPDGVQIGQRIVTSGDDGVFPPDIAVGLVAAVDGRAARAQLSADYRRLEFVRVLRWRRSAPADAPGDLILPSPLAGGIITDGPASAAPLGAAPPLGPAAPGFAPPPRAQP